jgi:hypothetical protein
MAKRQQGQGGTPTTWFDLKGKEGTLVTWDSGRQAEVAYRDIDGHVEDVRVKERRYGTGPNAQTGYVINITLRDREANERYIVSSGAGSRVTCRLLGQLNAADLSQPICIYPYLMEAGTEITDNETGQVKKLETEMAMTSVKHVIGKDGDRLVLSEGIKPYYNEAYGSALPAPETVMVNGKPLVQNGQEIKDRSKLENLTAELVQTLQAKINDMKQGQGQGHGEHGVNPEEAADAAQAADRNAMRARAA